MSSKKKGNAGENKFANWLQSRGIKAYKNSSSGGNEWKSDVHNSLGINFEVKTCKKINLKKCWQQTDRDSSLAKSMPMLAVHFDGMPENEWLMVLHSEDWIDMVTKSHQIAPKHPQIDPKQALDNPNDQRELKFALSYLKASIAKVTKLLDEKTN